MSATVSSSLTSISAGAFFLCNGFTGELTIPNTVTTIGDWAFTNCRNLTGSLTLPASGVVRLSVSNPKAVRGLKARLIGCETVSGSVAGWSVDAPGYAPGVILSVESDGLYAEFRRLGSIMIVW